MSREKENVIREKRTIEATKKNLMGPSGKFGVILQAFGTPVIRQGTSLMDVTFLENPFEEQVTVDYASTASGQRGPIAQRDEILTLSDEYVQNEGVLFDGLNRGLHLEIVYWNAESKLQVSYKGYVVYLEIAGELGAYAPFDDWENQIDRLFKAAKKRVAQMKIQEGEEMAKQIEKNKLKFWEKIKLRWGI